MVSLLKKRKRISFNFQVTLKVLKHSKFLGKGNSERSSYLLRTKLLSSWCQAWLILLYFLHIRWELPQQPREHQQPPASSLLPMWKWNLNTASQNYHFWRTLHSTSWEETCTETWFWVGSKQSQHGKDHFRSLPFLQVAAIFFALPPKNLVLVTCKLQRHRHQPPWSRSCL